MSRGKRTWAGFDYVTGKPVVMLRTEWQERIDKARAAKHKVRREGGEIFVHGADGLLTCEIYERDGDAGGVLL